MSLLNVQLNQLQYGAERIPADQLLPGHKEKIESALTNYFSLAKPKNKDFTVSLDHPELAEVTRTARYYQHLGLLQRRPSTSQEAETNARVTRGAVLAMQHSSIPGINGQLIAGARVAEDTLSVTRNILYAVPSIGIKASLINHLGYYAGILWAFFAMREISGGVDDTKRADTIGDKEGKRRAQARLLSGSIVATASTSYLCGRVCDSFGAVSTAGIAFSAASVLFGIGSVLAMANSYVGGYRCHSFQRRLSEYLENPNLPEIQKFQGALRFLKDAYSVTPEEMESLESAKIADLAEAKVKYLKRRTSMKSIYLIHNKVDQILAKLGNEKTQAEGIRDATLLFETVQTENRTKRALFILGFAAAALCFTGMLIMNFLSAGTLPFVFYGVASTIYLSLTIYNLSGSLLKMQNSSDSLSLEMGNQLQIH